MSWFLDMHLKLSYNPLLCKVESKLNVECAQFETVVNLIPCNDSSWINWDINGLGRNLGFCNFGLSSQLEDVVVSKKEWRSADIIIICYCSIIS